MSYHSSFKSDMSHFRQKIWGDGEVWRQSVYSIVLMISLQIMPHIGVHCVLHSHVQNEFDSYQQSYSNIHD